MNKLINPILFIMCLLAMACSDDNNENETFAPFSLEKRYYEVRLERNATSIPIINRMGVNAFNRLFDEIAGKPPRMQLELPYNCTTNPQAEVLVFNTIEPSNIFGVVFSSQIRANEYAHRYSNLNLQFVYDQNFFRPRKDFEYWR